MNRHDAFHLTPQDLTAIETELYRVEKHQLIARRIADVKTDYDPAAITIGYNWYDPAGSAKILATGGDAKDLSFVNEKAGRVTAKVHTIAVGVKFNREELMAHAMQPHHIKLDLERVEAAKEFIAEAEDRLFFTGDKTHKIPGILNKEGAQKELVTPGQKGTNETEKRKWTNKTPREILKDIATGRKKAKNKHIFQANALLLPPDQYEALQEPYADNNPMTILDWIKSKAFFEVVLPVRQLEADLNGVNADCFVILDNRKRILQLAVPREVEIGEPIYDILGNSEQAVTERCVGAVIRHPSSIYIGTGI